MRVLIVEDDSDTLNLIKTFLNGTGNEILTARRGDEALNIAISEKPDLAIIDGLIPGIHGFELCKRIKEDTRIVKKPRIIIMTSVYKAQRYKAEVIEYRADGFMIKPFRKEELLAKIDSVMKNKK